MINVLKEIVEMPQRRITGLFALRRSSGSASVFARSATPPTQKLRHILSALQMLRLCLFGRTKRRKQPERFQKFFMANYPKTIKALVAYSKTDYRFESAYPSIPKVSSSQRPPSLR